MDLLTDVLETFHLQSVLVYRGRVTAPWGVSFAPQKEQADASFHVVTEGKCLIRIAETGVEHWLNAGDFVLLPQGHAHSLRDAEDSPVYPLETIKPLFRNKDNEDRRTLDYGGSGETTRILCGKFIFQNTETDPLLHSLPPVLLVRGERGRSVDWLEATLAFLSCEADSNRPGANTVLSRLGDILFIQAVRAYLAEMPACEKGWLRATTDPALNRALAAIHQNPAHPWTVETLAQAACLSRSAFAARFTELMGEPPLQYLTRWRIHRAAELLRKSHLPLSEVALQAGYRSEAAFNRVFKRWIGTTPGQFRQPTTFG
ncbi:MAG: AraC family transcriptional regulator [Armatimonadaceae bacterium]